MHAASIRSVITEYDIGRDGWKVLHDLSRQRCRSPRDQLLQLIRYSLHQALNGEDVELNRSQLEALLDDLKVA